MPEYKKVGYLTSSFKLFHLKDQNKKEFSYHYHDFHKILILLNGDITYCIEGRSYQLAPNDPYESIIIYVSPDFLKKYKEPDCDLSHCLKQAAAEQSHVLRFHGSRAAKLKTAIQSLDHAKNDKDFAASLHQEILFLEFMIQLNRAAMHDGIEFINDSASDEKIIAVLNYLGEHLTEDISIDTLSAHFFLSRSYLMHTFKEQTGYTIGNYLSTKRLLLAKDLIAEGAPITEVCYACGFKNYSTFSRAYKKSFGEAPRESLQNLKS